ncbi:MAG: hypothetical protein K6C36_04085 [Clostridia bacterium]|nr:hypothetical protein [Clostridia bacterium]
MDINELSGAEEFIASIEAKAVRKCEELKSEAEKRSRSELKSAKKSAERQTKIRISDGKLLLSGQIGRKNAELASEERAVFFAEREKVRSEIFESVEKKVGSFTQSPQYADFILDSAKRISEIARGEQVDFLMRKEDLPLAETIRSACPGCTVSATDEITAGGLVGVVEAKSLRIDDSLDRRLADELERFCERGLEQ